MSDPNRDKHRQAVKVLRNLDSKYHSNPDKHRQTPTNCRTNLCKGYERSYFIRLGVVRAKCSGV